MLALLALFLLAAVACGLLGAWQLDRARERGEQAAQRAAAQEAQADPVPLADVLAPQTALTQDALARRVRVTGTWVPGTDLVVPDQEHGGEDGSVLIAALRVDDGGAVLPVARGWVALDAAAAAHAAAAGGPLAPSGGRVSLVGSLAAAQAAAPAAGPGQVGSISPAQLVNLWGGPIYDAYLRLDVADPPEAAPQVPLPVATSQSASLDLQNLAYAAQWWIFGGFAVFLWARLVRDEAERRTGHPAG
jgi:cytochrome oxidase assembly protein ShyY1